MSQWLGGDARVMGVDRSDAGTPYAFGFYDAIGTTGTKSAAAMLPLVFDLVRPASAIDVGRGPGAWVATLLRHGVDAFGVDGPWVGEELATCMEVAEHLLADAAAPLV